MTGSICSLTVENLFKSEIEKIKFTYNDLSDLKNGPSAQEGHSYIAGMTMVVKRQDIPFKPLSSAFH